MNSVLERLRAAYETPDGETWPFAGSEAKARTYECWETPAWAIAAILDAELLSEPVIDPCCGRGQMAEGVLQYGYQRVFATDLADWGYYGRQPGHLNCTRDIHTPVNFPGGGYGLVLRRHAGEQRPAAQL
jgi:hypothetical protein